MGEELVDMWLLSMRYPATDAFPPQWASHNAHEPNRSTLDRTYKRDRYSRNHIHPFEPYHNGRAQVHTPKTAGRGKMTT